MLPNASRENQQHQNCQYHQVHPPRTALRNSPAVEGYRPSSFLQNPELQISHIQPRGAYESYNPQPVRNSYQPQPYQLSYPNAHNMSAPPRPNNPSLPDARSRQQAQLVIPQNTQRFSFMETPVEVQQATFPPVAQKPSEPAISQSPVTDAPHSPYPEDKPQKDVRRITSPDATKHPVAPQPAAYTPVTYTPVAEQHQLSNLPQYPPQSHSAGPLPTKVHRESLAPIMTSNDPNYLATDPYSAHQRDPYSAHQRQFNPPPRTLTPIYDPNSLTGPNGVTPAIHQPGQIAHPNMDPGNDEWWHSLCECSGDISTCCLGCWCPCILYGRTQYRLTQRSAKKDPTDLLGYKSCNGSCGLMCILCGLQGLLGYLQHTRVRNLYKVQGSCASDIVRACCCLPCTLIQDEREVRDREEERRSRAGPASAVDVYRSPAGGMLYSPQ